MLMPKVTALISSIRAGEDTELELKEIVFRGDRVSFVSREDRTAPKLAEVFVSMANTKGSTVVMGGPRFGPRSGWESTTGKRDLLEQFVINAATDNCNPMIVPALNWEYLPAEDGAPKLCLIIEIPPAAFDVHQTSDGRYLQRIGSHESVRNSVF